jgi:hypothetical protein
LRGVVFQSINRAPTVFLSDQSAVGTSVKGKIKVETTGDDDFVGFVLGFYSGDFSNPLADYLLVDWKQGRQNYSGRYAPAGLAVSSVNGVVANEIDFWDHSGSISELARGTTLGSTGWTDNTDYTLEFNFTSTNLEVLIDGVSQIHHKSHRTVRKDGPFSLSVYYRDNPSLLLPVRLLSQEHRQKRGLHYKTRMSLQK